MDAPWLFRKRKSRENAVVNFFFQVISKSARKAPETMVSSIGQNVEEDPDTVRYILGEGECMEVDKGMDYDIGTLDTRYNSDFQVV